MPNDPQSAIRNPQSAIECVKISAFTLLALAGMAAAPAHAADGIVTITGEITDSTCKINGGDPPANIFVALPKISTTALKNVGDTAGATLFTIKLTDCPTSLTGNVKAHFEPGSTTDYANGSLYAYTNVNSVSAAVGSIPSPAAAKVSNLGIQLANPDGSKITIGELPSGPGEALNAQTDGKKTATLRYLARYVKTGDGVINAGKVVTYVQYSIVYP
ncbi:fimbrial protein [Bordetella avium]|uniref:fimbrial protein n=1 Tax=Bordetella avium TaxID=521 RepID=UPI000E69108E|nr:fimbrial protein [Bordetella avium]RIQ14794.1 fimbrial protein [Bordetella avium]RIQ61371.1 fimbrial protein [Bordetella avium]RIQ89451.1 fimbrial protein [Bordetella avium]